MYQSIGIITNLIAKSKNSRTLWSNLIPIQNYIPMPVIKKPTNIKKKLSISPIPPIPAPPPVSMIDSAQITNWVNYKNNKS